MSKPIIGSDVGGIRDLLGAGDVGSLFEAGNVDDLIDKITELCLEPNRRQVLGENGRKYVLQHRRWKDIVKQYLPIYERAMS